MATSSSPRTTTTSTVVLRRRLRKIRKRRSPAQRRDAERKLLKFVQRLPEFRRAKRVAAYLAVDGEIRADGLLRRARQRGKEIFVPRLRPGSRLAFVRWSPRQPVRKNRFHIAEPIDALRLSPRRLDLVFVPLTGFDAHGHRIGMGGGFYDRSFAFRLGPGGRPLPRLIGLAFECQRVDALPVQAWDVPLDAVLTERGVYRFRRRNTHS